MSSRQPANDAHYNTRILHPLARWLGAEHGRETVSLLASRAGLDLTALGDHNGWISQAQFETFLADARDLVRDDEAFKQACVHRMSEGYGPMRFLLWATSPGAVYAHAEKTYALMSTIGEPKILSRSRTALHVRIASDRPISRLNCLVRQAQSAALPTMWGLPPATLNETKCVAFGDDACEYQLRWFDHRRWFPPVIGAVIGGALAAVAAHLHLDASAAALGLPTLGGVIGFAFEMHRTNVANLAIGAEQNEALRLLAEEEAEARRELLELHHRQRNWTAVLEHDAAERTQMIQSVVERIEQKEEARNRQLRGFSHDLRSPLAIMRLGVEYLAPHAVQLGEHGTNVIEELDSSVKRMTRLLAELMDVTTAQTAAMQLAPQPIEIGALADRLRRRLRAMVHSRDIRASVFRTREAPDTVEVDPLLLDRITDNLLSNAAKYTERGSIVLEVDGSPGFLVLKVSDSGRGIDPERIERAFRPGGMDATARAEDSYGLGLSVVVQLLGQIGGRLEVMSKPGVGTTFWAYVPIKAGMPSTAPRARDAEPIDELVNKVVKIRRVKSA